MWIKEKRQQRDVLFGFDTIVGFPVDYDAWHWIIGVADWYEKEHGRIADRVSARRFEEWFWADHAKSDKRDAAECPEDKAWLLTYNYAFMDDWLARCLFVERDQVVVPSLNLKAAKQVFCQDERTKGELRKMGFIEDRIRVRNFHHAN